MRQHTPTIKLEPKSKLSSDDWRCLGIMVRKLQDQERSWLDEVEEKQQREKGVCIIGRIQPKMTIKEVKAFFKNNDVLFLARDPCTNKPIGFCAVERKFDLGWATCDGLYVEELWRNKKVATYLMQSALDKTKHDGLDSLDLRVSMKNKAAQKLYKKLGFSKTAYQMERWVSY